MDIWLMWQWVISVFIRATACGKKLSLWQLVLVNSGLQHLPEGSRLNGLYPACVASAEVFSAQNPPSSPQSWLGSAPGCSDCSSGPAGPPLVCTRTRHCSGPTNMSSVNFGSFSNNSPIIGVWAVMLLCLLLLLVHQEASTQRWRWAQ